jgi:hypothetical protein
VLSARFAKPETTIGTVGQWAGFPVRVRDLLPPTLRGLDKVIAWDAPVEAAVALDPLGEGKVPTPLAVFSVGLTSLDAALDFARKQGDAAPRVRPGVYRLEDSGPLNCLLSVAIGSAPARIICGKRRKDVDGLGAYAARGLPIQPAGEAQFEINMFAEPLQRRYAGEIASGRMLVGILLRQFQLDSPRFDRALSDAAYGLMDELVAFTKDLESLRIEGKVDAQTNALDLSFVEKFRGSTSWLVQAQKELAARAAPPPPQFLRMPQDSTMALFGIATKPELSAPIGRTLGELLEGYLEYKKFNPRTREEWKRAVESFFALDGQNYATAFGSLPGPLSKEKERRAVEGRIGWIVSGLTLDTKKYEAFLTGLLNVFTSRELRQMLEEEHGLKDNDWPKYRVKPLQVPGFKTAGKLYELTLSSNFIGLFDEKKLASMAASIDAGGDTWTPPSKPKLPKAYKIPIYIVVVNDGALTWAGASTDQKVLLEKFRITHDDKAATLSTRPGLDDVRKTAAVTGGFATLRYILDGLDSTGRPEMANLASKIPNHGETPIPFWASSGSDGTATTVSVKVRLADKVVADIAAMATQIPSLR